MIIELDAQPTKTAHVKFGYNEQCKCFRPLGHMYLNIEKDELTFAAHWPDYEQRGRMTIPARHVLTFIQWARAMRMHPGDKEAFDWTLKDEYLMPLAPRLLDKDGLQLAIETVQALGLRDDFKTHVDIVNMSTEDLMKLQKEIEEKISRKKQESA